MATILDDRYPNPGHTTPHSVVNGANLGPSGRCHSARREDKVAS